jgi:succinylglutamic semialdehyde dehydrogenase
MTKGAFIDGRWQSGTGPVLTSHDPATGQVVWQEASAGPDQVAAAVAAARRVFQAWSDWSREDRIALMRRYKAVLEARTPQMAEALSRETGKALWETTAELGSMIGKIEVSIAAFNERTGEKRTEMAFGQAVLRHRAHGVMAVLGPFNFPGHLPNGHIVPALLAGDCVVFKPSEETPLAGQGLVEALIAAGVPDGVALLELAVHVVERLVLETGDFGDFEVAGAGDVQDEEREVADEAVCGDGEGVLEEVEALLAVLRVEERVLGG